MHSAKEEYNKFIHQCEKTLTGSNKQLIALVKKRYDECSEKYKSSQEFAHLLKNYRKKMVSDSKHLFVHLKDCLNELKAYKNVGGDSRCKKRKNSGEYDSDGSIWKKRKTDDRTPAPASRSLTSSPVVESLASEQTHEPKQIDQETQARQKDDLKNTQPKSETVLKEATEKADNTKNWESKLKLSRESTSGKLRAENLAAVIKNLLVKKDPVPNSECNIVSHPRYDDNSPEDCIIIDDSPSFEDELQKDVIKDDAKPKTDQSVDAAGMREDETKTMCNFKEKEVRYASDKLTCPKLESNTQTVKSDSKDKSVEGHQHQDSSESNNKVCPPDKGVSEAVVGESVTDKETTGGNKVQGLLPSEDASVYVAIDLSDDQLSQDTTESELLLKLQPIPDSVQLPSSREASCSPALKEMSDVPSAPETPQVQSRETSDSPSAVVSSEVEPMVISQQTSDGEPVLMSKRAESPLLFTSPHSSEAASPQSSGMASPQVSLVASPQVSEKSSLVASPHTPLMESQQASGTGAQLPPSEQALDTGPQLIIGDIRSLSKKDDFEVSMTEKGCKDFINVPVVEVEEGTSPSKDPEISSGGPSPGNEEVTVLDSASDEDILDRKEVKVKSGSSVKTEKRSAAVVASAGDSPVDSESDALKHPPKDFTCSLGLEPAASVDHHTKPSTQDVRQHKHHSSPTPETSSESGASERKQEASEKHIYRLEKLLGKLRDEIDRVQTQELSLDDLEAEDSSYIYEDKLKKKFVTVWNKLCELKKRAPSTGRPTERRFTYQGTRYPEVNKKIEKLINKKKIFPDFHDMKKLIAKVNHNQKLNLRNVDVDRLAREAFTDVGNMLQQRRQEDFVTTFGCKMTDSTDVARNDPALFDPQLRQKLDQNRTDGKARLEAVIKKFSDLQHEHGEPADDEVPEKSEDEKSDEDQEITTISAEDLDSDKEELVKGVKKRSLVKRKLDEMNLGSSVESDSNVGRTEEDDDDIIFSKSSSPAKDMTAASLTEKTATELEVTQLTEQKSVVSQSDVMSTDSTSKTATTKRVPLTTITKFSSSKTIASQGKEDEWESHVISDAVPSPAESITHSKSPQTPEYVIQPRSPLTPQNNIQPRSPPGKNFDLMSPVIQESSLQHDSPATPENRIQPRSCMSTVNVTATSTPDSPIDLCDSPRSEPVQSPAAAARSPSPIVLDDSTDFMEDVETPSKDVEAKERSSPFRKNVNSNSERTIENVNCVKSVFSQGSKVICTVSSSRGQSTTPSSMMSPSKKQLQHQLCEKEAQRFPPYQLKLNHSKQQSPIKQSGVQRSPGYQSKLPNYLNSDKISSTSSSTFPNGRNIQHLTNKPVSFPVKRNIMNQNQPRFLLGRSSQRQRSLNLPHCAQSTRPGLNPTLRQNSVSPSRPRFSVGQSSPRQNSVSQSKPRFPVGQSSARQNSVSQSKPRFPEGQSSARQNSVSSSRPRFPVGQSLSRQNSVSQSKPRFPLGQSSPRQNSVSLNRPCFPFGQSSPRQHSPTSIRHNPNMTQLSHRQRPKVSKQLNMMSDHDASYREKHVSSPRTPKLEKPMTPLNQAMRFSKMCYIDVDESGGDEEDDVMEVEPEEQKVSQDVIVLSDSE